MNSLLEFQEKRWYFSEHAAELIPHLSVKHTNITYLGWMRSMLNLDAFLATLSEKDRLVLIDYICTL